MPNIDRHNPGSFCWFELATTDQPSAKAFYKSLFGWDAEDFPMGDNGYYTMFSLEGRNVGAAYTLHPEQHKGLPPNWGVYVAVVSADAAAKRAEELGGNIYMAPFDVGAYGRMSVIGDPTGAAFSVWEAKQHPGVGLTEVDGTACWADLYTRDPSAAKAFYGGLFGWDIKPGEKDPSGYLHIFNGGRAIGGIPPCHDPSIPPHWMIYFLVSRCVATVDKGTSLGGSVLMPSEPIPNVGTMAIMRDPRGAGFALFQPDPGAPLH